jgi:hypothetical protein
MQVCRSRAGERSRDAVGRGGGSGAGGGCGNASAVFATAQRLRRLQRRPHGGGSFDSPPTLWPHSCAPLPVSAPLECEGPRAAAAPHIGGHAAAACDCQVWCRGEGRVQQASSSSAPRHQQPIRFTAAVYIFHLLALNSRTDSPPHLLRHCTHPPPIATRTQPLDSPRRHRCCCCAAAAAARCCCCSPLERRRQRLPPACPLAAISGRRASGGGG